MKIFFVSPGLILTTALLLGASCQNLHESDITTASSKSDVIEVYGGPRHSRKVGDQELWIFGPDKNGHYKKIWFREQKVTSIESATSLQLPEPRILDEKKQLEKEWQEFNTRK